jgi:hypothetical protein
LNHHWTKNVIASQDGSKLYVSVGSNSNVGENGLEAEQGRAAIWEVDRASGQHRIFASGLRNPNGMAWEPQRQAVDGGQRARRDRQRPGAGLHHLGQGRWFMAGPSAITASMWTCASPRKTRTGGQGHRTGLCGGPAHRVARIDLRRGQHLPAPFTHGAFIGQHGSWNRKPHSGYKVIFVPFEGGKPKGQPVDVLTGFLDKDEKAMGRPVGVVIDKQGDLLVADDVGNKVWRFLRLSNRSQDHHKTDVGKGLPLHIGILG